jgi:hypothetical protein
VIHLRTQVNSVKHFFFSRTFLGAAAVAAMHVAADPKNPMVWGNAIGGLVMVYGARAAVAKNGAGK